MAKTRTKRPPTARPDIIDLVTGVTQEDIKKTDTQIAAVIENINALKVRLALLVLEGLAQKIQLNGLDANMDPVVRDALNKAVNKAQQPKP